MKGKSPLSTIFQRFFCGLSICRNNPCQIQPKSHSQNKSVEMSITKSIIQQDSEATKAAVLSSAGLVIPKIIYLNRKNQMF